MAKALPRLKPDPIPAIHPVPEYAASGPLAAVYDRTKRGLGVPWMGVVAMAFAHYPQFYDRLWSAMEPVVASEAFVSACRDLRFAAESEASTLQPPQSLSAWKPSAIVSGNRRKSSTATRSFPPAICHIC